MRASAGLRACGKLLFAGALAFGAFHLARPLRVDRPAAPAPDTPKPASAPATPPSSAAKPSAAGFSALPAMPLNDDGPFVVKRILPIEGALRHGDYVWDDKGVPAGPIVITVDIAAETLSVFRDGYEIGTAVILYGADNKPTPLGTFPILQKDADHVSNIYDAPMPYMLRLTNDGVAIHGSNVQWDAATAGCIGVPKKFAAMLFAQAHIGDRVIVTNGKRLHMGQAIMRAPA